MSKPHQRGKQGDLQRRPRSSAVGACGITTETNFDGFTSFIEAVCKDLCDGRISPAVGNAVFSGGRLLLKAAEMKVRFSGSLGNGHAPRLLESEPEHNGKPKEKKAG